MDLSSILETITGIFEGFDIAELLDAILELIGGIFG